MTNPNVPGQFTEYHKFAGKFVTEYAELEFILRFLIRRMAGLNEAQYDILIGFPRSGEARALAKKLADIQPLDTPSRKVVNDAFEQLANITQLRDWVVHFGGIHRTPEQILMRGKVPSPWPDRLANLNDMWEAVADLNQITTTLNYYLAPDMPPDAVTEEFRHRQGPWRYKPLPQLKNPPPRGDCAGLSNPPPS